MNVNAPKRIVSFAPPVTEILEYMGLSDRITTAKEFFENQPPVSDRQKPEFWFSTAESRVQSLRADLAITYSIAQQDLHKRLKERGYNVLHLDPMAMRDIEDSFHHIGKATGMVEEGKRLAQDFAGGLSALTEKIPMNSYRPKLYCEEWNKPPSVAGSWWTELMNQTGAHYFPILARELSRAVKIEEVVRFDPEIIVFSIYGEGLGFDPAEILKRIGWERITAVRKRRVFTVDDSLLNFPGPKLIQGAKVIQSILGESFWGWPLIDPEQARRVIN